MIYHEVSSGNFLEIYSNLEELVCLKYITNQTCFLKIDNNLKPYFDLSEFELIEFLPENLIESDISDCVCVYEYDINDVVGSEFISYRKNQKPKIYLLDKFNHQNIKLIFSKPNNFEAKYWSSRNYNIALEKAKNFKIPDVFNLNKLFKTLPLIIIDESFINSKTILNFEECYYINEPRNFLRNNNLTGYNIVDLINKHHISFSDIDINIVLLSLTCFESVYSTTSNLLANTLSKNVDQFIMNKTNCGSIENYKFKPVNEKGLFEFSRAHLNIDRNELLSFLRFRNIYDGI
jgi:hypothetical protein